MNPDLLKASFILIAAISFVCITQFRQIKNNYDSLSQKLLGKSLGK